MPPAGPALPATDRAARYRRRAPWSPAAAAAASQGRTPRSSRRRCRVRRDGSRTRFRYRTGTALKRSPTAIDFGRRHEQEHRVRIDEAADQPGAGDAVDLRPRARHPDRASLRVARGQLATPAPAAALRLSSPQSRPPAFRRIRRRCRSQAAVPSRASGRAGRRRWPDCPANCAPQSAASSGCA